jgi:CBS domain-containing protein
MTPRKHQPTATPAQRRQRAHRADHAATPVGEIMTPDPVCCVPADTAQAAATIMKERDTGIVPVIEARENSRLVGVVTDRDLCLSAIAEGKGPALQLKECMTTHTVSCRPTDTVETVVSLMEGYQIRRIPVTDEQQRVVGMVSMADLVRRTELPANKTQEALQSISEPTEAPSQTRAEEVPEEGVIVV